MPRHRLRTLLLVLAIGPPVLEGCTNSPSTNFIPPSEANALEIADSLELLSLEPSEFSLEDPGHFHGWKELGRVSIDGETKQRVVAALSRGVAENRGTVASCFNPRHGIRVKSEDRFVDFVICFHCMSAESYIDDKPEKGFLVTRSPQPVFDEVLQRAAIPLAKPAN